MDGWMEPEEELETNRRLKMRRRNEVAIRRASDGMMDGWRDGWMMCGWMDGWMDGAGRGARD
jgi:hypothetical protein